MQTFSRSDGRTRSDLGRFHDVLSRVKLIRAAGSASSALRRAYCSQGLRKWPSRVLEAEKAKRRSRSRARAWFREGYRPTRLPCCEESCQWRSLSPTPRSLLRYLPPLLQISFLSVDTLLSFLDDSPSLSNTSLSYCLLCSRPSDLCRPDSGFREADARGYVRRARLMTLHNDDDLLVSTPASKMHTYARWRTLSRDLGYGLRAV